MSEQPSRGPLGQFLGDLSAIREKRNVSLEALRNATKVYPNVITQFELDGLKDHPLFNSLYVRAFIRSYAKAIDIPAEEVLRAYDGALEGEYRRELALEHLDLPPAEIQALRAVQKEVPKVESVFSADKFEFERSKKIKEAEDSSATVTFIPKPKQGENDSRFTSIVGDVKEGVQLFFESGKQNAIIQWGLLAGGIGLGLFVILQLLSFQSDTSTTTESQVNTSSQPQLAEDSATSVSLADSVTALPAQPIEVDIPPVPIVLGDSIPLYIVAEGGALDPFRIKIDRDLRRPYWLDQGDSILFYLKNQVVIEDDLSLMKISFDGKSYPIYATDSLASVVINRDSLQSFMNGR